MARKKGTIVQFGKKGYGFILGKDGTKYFFHQKNIDDVSNIKINSKVNFTFKLSEKGPIANDINLEIEKQLSDSTIKFMFLLLFSLQISTFFILYYLF